MAATKKSAKRTAAKKRPAAKRRSSAKKKKAPAPKRTSLKRKARKGLKAARGGIDNVLQAGGKTWKRLKSKARNLLATEPDQR
jgi:hypothetical protein